MSARAMGVFIIAATAPGSLARAACGHTIHRRTRALSNSTPAACARIQGVASEKTSHERAPLAGASRDRSSSPASVRERDRRRLQLSAAARQCRSGGRGVFSRGCGCKERTRGSFIIAPMPPAPPPKPPRPPRPAPPAPPPKNGSGGAAAAGGGATAAGGGEAAEGIAAAGLGPVACSVSGAVQRISSKAFARARLGVPYPGPAASRPRAAP